MARNINNYRPAACKETMTQDFMI